jgi:tellurite resistance protein TerC
VLAVVVLAFLPNPAFDAVGLLAGALGFPARPFWLACALGKAARYVLIAYLFGAFLVFTGLRLVLERAPEVRPSENPMLRLARRFLPVTSGLRGGRFLAREGGRWLATPLLLTLIVVESTDLIFAVDSIPAVFAVTSDPFIVYTSNVGAILGLRSLYFALEGALGRFRYLPLGLVLVLVFVGAKMLLADLYPIPAAASLAVTAFILASAIAASWLGGRETARPRPDEHAGVIAPASSSPRHRDVIGSSR